MTKNSKFKYLISKDPQLSVASRNGILSCRDAGSRKALEMSCLVLLGLFRTKTQKGREVGGKGGEGLEFNMFFFI